MTPEPPHRFAPQRTFPPYAYAGSPQPHPRNHPEGHSRGLPEIVPPPLDPERWRESENFLHGIDLFNHGYYWEAHEAWEGLWLAAGKTGPVSEMMKGLIKLAAAGVKARQAEPEGVRRHAERARAHFEAARTLSGADRFAGMSLRKLMEFSGEVGRRAEEWPAHEGSVVAVVFDRVLFPKDRP